MAYSKSIQHLITAFAKLPSVGKRTGERFVFHLLKSGKKDVGELTLALRNLIENVKSCEICWNFSDQSPCEICSDSRRDKTIICVVAEPQDLQTIESMKRYTGVYHVLRGTIEPDDEHIFEKVKINELINRVEKEQPRETILALNPDIKGETTMMILEKRLKEISSTLRVTRLAKGLPMGSDLQYADEMTLKSAFEHRVSQ